MLFVFLFSNLTKKLIHIIFDKAYNKGEKISSGIDIAKSKVPGPTRGKKSNCKIQTAINNATPKA